MSEDLLVHEFGMIVALHFGRLLPDLKKKVFSFISYRRMHIGWKKTDFSTPWPCESYR